MAWSVMTYGSLQAEFMETEYNVHIHRYGMMHDIEFYHGHNQVFYFSQWDVTGINSATTTCSPRPANHDLCISLETVQ